MKDEYIPTPARQVLAKPLKEFYFLMIRHGADYWTTDGMSYETVELAQRGTEHNVAIQGGAKWAIVEVQLPVEVPEGQV